MSGLTHQGSKNGSLLHTYDKLAEADNRFKKTMFANPNTKVTLEVKTKRDPNNWSSMLSDNTTVGKI